MNRQVKAPAGAPASVDEYIAGFPPKVRTILQKVRRTVRSAAPGAAEAISYRIPSYRLDGILVYFAAFRNHVGLYPPVRGDAKLVKAASPYAGEKGNLRFALDKPLPYALIRKIVQARAKENRADVKRRRTR